MCWGATQNQNESFNSLIWNLCPKTEFCSADIVEIATNLAVITFNSGEGAIAMTQLPLWVNYINLPSQQGRLQDLASREYKGKELVKKRRHQMHLDRVITEEGHARDEG